MYFYYNTVQKTMAETFLKLESFVSCMKRSIFEKKKSQEELCKQSYIQTLKRHLVY